MNNIDMSKFDSLCDELEQYVNKQGYTLGNNAELCQKVLDSINMLHIHNIATDNQSHTMMKKFIKLFHRTLRVMEGWQI